MNDYKYLIKNIGILTISNFATKFLSFFLLPLYTGVLSTEEYGTFDLYSTTISLLYPILSICVSDSVIRFLLERNKDKESVISISAKYVVISIVAFLFLFAVNVITNAVPELNAYKMLFILVYVVTVLNSWLSGVARGQERIKDISLASIISSIGTILLNIIFLVWMKFGIVGYFLATILGTSMSIVYYVYVTNIFQSIHTATKDHNLDKEMRRYGTGLMVNSISWWVNNSLDKYMVLYMCGIAANGLISVAYKLPTVLSTIQNLFEQAWVLSAVKKYNKEDADGFFVRTYNLYGFVMAIAASAIIMFTKILSALLFKKDFYEAWSMIPFFSIAVVFSAAAGFCGGVFAAQKRTDIISKTTFIGAIVNTILNAILIFSFGVIGGAVATMISNAVVMIVRLFYVKQQMNFQIRVVRDALTYSILLFQTLILLICNSQIQYVFQLLLLVLIVLLYNKEVLAVLKKVEVRKI
mgnify:FL=1